MYLRSHETKRTTKEGREGPQSLHFLPYQRFIGPQEGREGDDVLPTNKASVSSFGIPGESRQDLRNAHLLSLSLGRCIVARRDALCGTAERGRWARTGHIACLKSIEFKKERKEEPA